MHVLSSRKIVRNLLRILVVEFIGKMYCIHVYSTVMSSYRLTNKLYEKRIGVLTRH